MTSGQVVMRELRRALHPPFETPAVVIVNGLLMTGAWLFLPTAAQDALFAIHGDFAFALVLSSWMYADVPATNVLGTGAQASLEVLDDPRGLRRLLIARNFVLWMFVTPICVLVAIGIGIYEGDAIRTALVVVAIIVPPFGALGISAWLGVWFPYHPIPLAERWRLRTTSRFHMLYRWLALVLTPYVLVPFLAALTLVPAYVLWFIADNGLSTRVSDGWFAVGALLTCAVSLGLWFIGLRGSTRIVHGHHDELVAYLGDPTRG
jgi:hypothetical protein